MFLQTGLDNNTTGDAGGQVYVCLREREMYSIATNFCGTLNSTLGTSA